MPHVHDQRKTVTTWLREEKLVSSEVCDLILHHARKGVTASHYDFSTLEGPVRTRCRCGQTTSALLPVNGFWVATSST